MADKNYYTIDPEGKLTCMKCGVRLHLCAGGAGPGQGAFRGESPGGQVMLGHPGGETHSRYLIELSFLPPCPCGGVTRRIDTVSRREGEISMERLDSALFPMETLIDYRASFDGTLRLEARTLDGGGEKWLKEAAMGCCPDRNVTVQVFPALAENVPMYPGKRYVRLNREESDRFPPVSESEGGSGFSER